MTNDIDMQISPNKQSSTAGAVHVYSEERDVDREAVLSSVLQCLLLYSHTYI